MGGRRVGGESVSHGCRGEDCWGRIDLNHGGRQGAGREHKNEKKKIGEGGKKNFGEGGSQAWESNPIKI